MPLYGWENQGSKMLDNIPKFIDINWMNQETNVGLLVAKILSLFNVQAGFQQSQLHFFFKDFNYLSDRARKQVGEYKQGVVGREKERSRLPAM